MQLSLFTLLLFFLWTVPVGGNRNVPIAVSDASQVETEVHITAQEKVVYVGESISFTCTTRSGTKPDQVSWFMYEQDVTQEGFTSVSTSENIVPADKTVNFSSTLTITKALFNHTSIVRCRVKMSGPRVFHLSTPMTITQNTTGLGKQIREQCTVTDKCIFERSFCKMTSSTATSGTCQCEPDYPIVSIQNDMSCLKAAKLNESCTDTEQCRHLDNGSHCEKEVCRCKGDYVLEGGKCAAKAEAATCQSTSACLDANAECVDGRCVCKLGYALNPTTRACEATGDQEFQLAVIGVSSVAVLLVLSAITAACYVMNKRRDRAASGGRY